MGKITCMVLDDDNIDCLTVKAFLQRYPHLECIGAYLSAETAMAAAKEHRPDVLFLDVDMPGLSGLQVREQLLDIPACIFITAFPEYAVDAFELSALDFLVKPVTGQRFERAIQRVDEYIALRRRSDQLSHTLGADVIFIKEGYEKKKVRMDEVLYLEAFNKYTCIITADKKYTVLAPLHGLLNEDAFRCFVRIHRSYAVQKNFVTRIGTADVDVQGRTLPVGRTYKDTLHELAR
jgi:DNA-binding LytR/AlgR family response regulator